jgi:hypothetical protein
MELSQGREPALLELCGVSFKEGVVHGGRGARPPGILTKGKLLKE